jgi:hypothetical protein
VSHLNTIFNQLLSLVPRHEFEKSVSRSRADKYVKYFSCWQQFIVLLYAQIRKKESLRDIASSLRTQNHKWYHLGLTNICRSTLSDANAKRSFQVFEDLFYHLLDRCRDLTPKHKFRFKNPLYTIDATTVALCLSLFPWAKYRRTKGALKMHFLYDHAGCLPSFLVVTEGSSSEIRIVKEEAFASKLLPDSIISIDRAYIDFKWLFQLNKQRVFFVTRLKKNMSPIAAGQHAPPKNRKVLNDQIVLPPSFFQSGGYHDQLRLVTYYDPDSEKTLQFLTNNFSLAPTTIAAIYKARWQIELFFKWIKQNLKIKSFLGTSQNAVLTQVWVAMCYYLLLSYIKYQTKFKYPLIELSRVLRETLLDRVSLVDILSLNSRTLFKLKAVDSPQLQFF